MLGLGKEIGALTLWHESLDAGPYSVVLRIRLDKMWGTYFFKLLYMAFYLSLIHISEPTRPL